MHLKTLLALAFLTVSSLPAKAQNFPAGWELSINGETTSDLNHQLDWFTHQTPKTAKQRNRGRHLDHEHFSYSWKKFGITINANQYDDPAGTAEVKSIQISFEPKFLRKREKGDFDLSVTIGGNPISTPNLAQTLVGNGWELFRESGPLVQGKPLYGAVYVYKSTDLRLSLSLDRSNKKPKQLTIAFGQEG